MKIKRVYPADLIEKKKNNQAITMLRHTDNLFEVIDDAGIDLILVGDSVGNVYCEK